MGISLDEDKAQRRRDSKGAETVKELRGSRLHGRVADPAAVSVGRGMDGQRACQP